MMRICVDLTALADNFSGIERYAASITYEMVGISNDIYILLFKEKVHPMFNEIVSRDNIETIILPKCNKLIFNQIRLPLVLNKVTADWFLFLAFPVPLLLFKKNMVSTIHDICCWDCPETMNGLSVWYFRISHRIAIKKCRTIITISEFSKKRIVDKLRYPEDKIWLIYCGVDSKFQLPQLDRSELKIIRKKYNLPQQYILSLSTLEPRKNISLLIDAYGEIVKTEPNTIPLVLAGRKGWNMNELLAGIDETIKDKIVFTGFIDDEDLPAVYGCADFFVFPSKYEGFGIPPLEAMACGTPVLSSDATSLSEVVGEAGLYFVSDSKKSLIVQLNEVLHKMDKKSKTKVNEQVKKFLWASEAKKLLYSLKKK